MTSAPSRPAARSLLLGAAVAISALLLTACSGTATAAKTADPAQIAAAKTSIDAMTAEPTFGLTASDAFATTKAAGKKLWIIDISSSIELVQVSDAATTTALKAVGASVTTFDGKGSVTEYARGIQEAINDKADAIALYAIDPTVVSGPIQQAKAAGIPVIAVQFGDPGAKLPDGVVAQATYPYSTAGAGEANWITASANGAAVGIELISAPDVSNSKAIVSGFTDTIAKNCPNCTVYHDEIAVADWSTKIGTQVNSSLNAHPDIKYVVPVYDGMATFAIPSIKTAGRKDVKIVSFNASKSVMKFLASGDTVGADIGSPQAWEGWALADQFLRVVTGNTPLADTKVGLRLFTSDNVGSLDLGAAESEWYGVDFASKYKTLWGVH
jgi:ribose transport system substrate-binding protein